MTKITTTSTGMVIRDGNRKYYTSRGTWSVDILNAKVFRSKIDMKILDSHTVVAIKQTTTDTIQEGATLTTYEMESFYPAFDTFKGPEPSKSKHAG